MPFRSWCRFCVFGRGRNAPHPHSSGREIEEVEPLDDDLARQFQIRKWMIEKYGPTSNCRGCIHLLAGRDKRAHTEAYRERVRGALSGDEEGRRVLRREDARLAEYPGGREEERRSGNGTERVERSDEGFERGDSGDIANGDISRPAGFFPRSTDRSGASSASRPVPRDHDPAVADRRMREAGVGSNEPDFPFEEDRPGPSDAPRYRTRGYLRRSREEEAEIRHRFAATPDQDEVRLLLRLSPGDCLSRSEEEHEESSEVLQKASSEMAWDDVSGARLDARKVRMAREEEIGHAERKGVWRKITRDEAHRRGIKIIKVRWIDINKGDWEKEKYRSRLVAKEFNTSAEQGLFAATPP
ncbi:hypothetical protein N9L68_05635 [bacterium]|nr:hypothetical protein [bacterium]